MTRASVPNKGYFTCKVELTNQRLLQPSFYHIYSVLLATTATLYLACD